MKKLAIIVTLLALVIGSSFFITCKTSKQVAVQNEGIIRGYIFADVNGGSNAIEHVLLPDVTVTIKDENGEAVEQVISKLDGSYTTKHLKYGHYKIVLSRAGFKDSNYDGTVENASNHPGPLQLNLNNENYVWGTVTLKDGSAGYFKQPVFGVSINTRVSISTGTTSAAANCNIYGYYLIPGVEMNNGGEISAVCENAKVSARFNGQKRNNLTINNTNPKINSIVAYNETGKSILRTLPNKTVKLIADVSDQENNTLHYKWIPFGKFAGFVSKDAKEIEWTLPSGRGIYEMDLMVLDGFGGVAYKSYSISAEDGMVKFSGIVTDIDGADRIPNAAIRINGQSLATTDAKGYFSTKISANDNERYVLNVVKSGYTLSSTIYMKGAVQKEYKLIPSTTDSFMPTEDIQIAEKSDRHTFFQGKMATRSPTSLFIPKNSIADSLGNLVKKAVTISVRSINVADANGHIPGNFGGLKDGKNVRLEIYGAVDVQVRDKANPLIKYNLLKTATANLDIPILSSQLSKAAKNITLWDYNETTGMWESIGSAVKQGAHYKGLTKRFSVLNAGLELTNGTYIVLKDNPSNSVFSIAGSISIKLFTPQSLGGVAQVSDVINNLQPGDIANGLPIVNLPANTVVTIQIIKNGTVINTLNPRTGPVVPNSVGCCPPPSPLPPYDPTVQQIFMTVTNPVIAQNQLDQFLTGEENNAGATDADNYYAYIGASNYTKDVHGNTVAPHPITFAEWKAKNGFDAANGAGDINSVYYNAGDLGFWRGMHEKTFNGITAFYVSNFGNDVDAINNDPLAHNNDPTAAKTVCMEYSPVTSGSNITKFYIFNANGDLVNSANLDNNSHGPDNGLKFLPGLCITCHGGGIETLSGAGAQINSSQTFQAYYDGHPDENPNFLPFDLKSFFYSTATGHTRNDQEENLRKLNNQVLQIESPSTTSRTKAIVDFINASYAGHSGNPGQGYIENAVVDAGNTDTWSSLTPINTVVPANFYVDVVATSCRTCHISRTDPKLWFDTQQKFIKKKSAINFAVCPTSGTKFMPNSKVTFINFWTNEAPKRNEEIGKFLNNNAATCQ